MPSRHSILNADHDDHLGTKQLHVLHLEKDQYANLRTAACGTALTHDRRVRQDCALQPGAHMALNARRQTLT